MSSQNTLFSQETIDAVATSDENTLKTAPWYDAQGRWHQAREWPANRRAYLKENAYFDLLDGVYKWKSNNSVPPEECLVDSLTPAQLERHEKIRNAQIRRSIEAYRESRKNHVPSDEELFEMRAAFGPGAEVVDAITGQTWKV